MKQTNGLKIAVLALACFATSISEFAIVGIIDVVAASLNVPVSMAGQLLTAFALSGSIGVPLAVMALSQLNRRDVMTVALVLVAAGSLLCSLASGFGLLVASRVLMAIGSGIFAVSSFAVAPELAEPGHEARAVSTVTLGFNGALVLGLPIGRFFTAVLPWTAVFWFVGAASALLIPAVRSFVPAEKTAAPLPLKRQLGYLRRPRVLFTFGITLLWTAGYATLYSYITPYLQETTSLAAAALSAVLLVYGIATLVGNRLGGWMCDRYGVRRTILVGIALQGGMLVALFATSGPDWLVVACVAAWGLFAWIPSPVINLAVVQAAPEASDVMLSLNNSATQLAYAAGGAIGGAIVAMGSAHNLAIAALALVALGAGSTVLVTREDAPADRAEALVEACSSEA